MLELGRSSRFFILLEHDRFRVFERVQDKLACAVLLARQPTIRRA